MNRRQKIIVSVTGIFIVLLILIGLTYGYFLTRITGNGNPTSISVTTANLELVYGDGTTALLTSATPIEPGKFSSSKDFTVTNNGNALTDYAVTLEDFSITYANDTVIDGQSVKAGTVTKMEYPNDMKMTITCVIESDDEDRNGQACGNIDSTLPTENSILLTNSIEVDDIHKYVLTLTYIDSGIDQSKDMNKTIKGKIDIIDPKSTIDLEGTVASYQTGDYVEINSTPIKSEILDGNYKLIGVEPGSHTLYVKYKDTEGNIQTRGSQSLTIKKGDEASVSGNTITFTDSLRIAKVDIDETFDLTVEDIKITNNPYSDNTSTLAYHIVNNSINAKDSDVMKTKFTPTPLTKPFEEKISGTPTGGYSEITLEIYGDGTIAPIHSNPEVFKSDDWMNKAEAVENCNESMKNKYLFDFNNFIDGSVYKITGCNNNLFKVEIDELNYEKTLSLTEDDYGTSHYYRGNVKDNFVNFAGMCWRIVRIAGDGSIKLILDDKNTTCDDTEDTDGTGETDYAYTNESEIVGWWWTYGKPSYLEPSENKETSMLKAFYDFQTTGKLKDYKNKLKAGDWCIVGDETETVSTLDNYVPTLKCSGNPISKFKTVEGVSTETEMYVGTLTADEVMFAGIAKDGFNTTTVIREKTTYLTYRKNGHTVTFSPNYNNGDNIITIGDYDSQEQIEIVSKDNGINLIVPSVSLKKGTTIISGNGTQMDPYVIQ